jgi:DNA-binding LacI/PurR family transcriptional regulator
MRASLQDVATRAGVSVKTVSGALNGSAARMSAKTRERIETIALELGYIANVAASSTRKGYMPIIGILADGLITSPYATDIMRSFDREVRQHGMSVLVTNMAKGDVEAGLADIMRFRPKAVGLAAMYHKYIQMPAMADNAIHVLINCRDSAGVVPSIVPDERQAGEEAARQLFASGRKRLAFLNLPGLLAGELRLEGLQAAHASAGLELRNDWIRPATNGSTYSDRAKSAVAAHLLDVFSGKDCPDALVCGNDRIAMEAYAQFARMGIKVPQDVAVIGFDDQVEIATRLDPPLSTMALPFHDMGRIAAEALLGNGKLPPLTEVPFRFKRRESIQ